MNKTILNVGGGKLKPLDLDVLNNYFLINIDPIYQSDNLNIIDKFNEFKNEKKGKHEYFFNDSIFEFLPIWLEYFDLVTMYRFLEHVKRDEILYLIYLLSTATKVGSLIDVIVPNYVSLAKRIINEDPFKKDFVREDIITSTELFNEPDMPHCLIWTPKRAHYYFELEGRFKITNLFEEYEFDGRDIYMRFTAERI